MSGPSFPTRDELALDAALDALARGDRGPLDDLDGDTRATIELLTGWAELARMADPVPVTDAVPAITPAPARQGRATRRTGRAPGAGPAQARHRPSPWSIAAWIAILLVAGTALLGVLPRLLEEDAPPATSPSSLFAASPEATTATAPAPGPVNMGGGPGHAWTLGPEAPIAAAPELAGDRLGSLWSPPLVVDGTVILTTVDDTGPSGFRTARYDLATGEELWRAPEPLLGPFATDGTWVYGIMPIRGEDGGLRGPAALDLATGQVAFASGLWPTAPLAAAPVVSDGFVYFTDGLGNVTAIRTGDTVPAWSSPARARPPATVSPETLLTTASPGGSLVVAGDAVYTSRPSHTVVKLDAQTGEELGTVNVVDDLRADVALVSMQAHEDQLVVIARLQVPDRPSREALPAAILVYDAGTLELEARADLAYLHSENMVLTGDAIVVAARQAAADPVQLFRIDPASGAIGGPVGDVTLDSEFPAVGLSAAASTLMVIAPDGRLAFIDLATGDLLLERRYEDTLFSLTPVQLDGQAPVVVSTDGEIFTLPPGSGPET